MDKCLICGEEVDTERHFYRKHKLTAEEYYHKYIPRFDLLTKELIPFKSKDQYFAQEFAKRENLKMWIDTQPADLVKEYLASLLIDRKERKKLVYTPSQVELRSLNNFPSIITYQRFFHYYKFCESIGLKNKYKFESPIHGPIQDIKVIIDSREQLALKFEESVEVINEKLDFGDYLVSSGDYKVYFERKTLNDFVGTLTGGFTRFEKELSRARDAGEHLVVLVEAELGQALEFKKHLDYKDFKVSTDYVFRNVRDLIQTFPNVQFLFINGRGAAISTMLRILSTCGGYKTLDLQLFYDLKML